MKYVKLFESFKKKNIDNICKRYGIENYTINNNGTINVDGGVNLSFSGLNKMPLKFRNVTGNFNCDRNQLTSLEDCPESVDSFFCDNNKLTSLEGCPESVSNSFNCNTNYLTTLEGCPKSVGGYFSCYENYITSLKGCPGNIGGDFSCSFNNIASFEYLPLSIGGNFYCSDNPICNIWVLFQDYYKIEFLNDCDALREPDADSEEPIVILDRLNYFLEEIGKPTVTKVKGYKCI